MRGQTPTADEIQQAARWEKLEAALREHYHEPELGAVRALCSAFAAHTLSGPPVCLAHADSSPRFHEDRPGQGFGRAPEGASH